jgi:hypothetical protein
MKGKSATTVYALLMTLSVGRAALAQHRLDLTDPNTLSTSPTGGGGIGSGYSGMKLTALPIELRVLRFDQQSAEFGTPITFEISLKNVGTQSITIPWSPDREAIEREGQRSERLLLSLGAVDANGREYRFGSIVLSGSPSIRGSLETLSPGETATIKAKTTITLQPGLDDQIVAIVAAGSIPVRAFLTVDGDPAVHWDRLSSMNAVPLSFQLPKHR